MSASVMTSDQPASIISIYDTLPPTRPLSSVSSKGQLSPARPVSAVYDWSEISDDTRTTYVDMNSHKKSVHNIDRVNETVTSKNIYSNIFSTNSNDDGKDERQKYSIITRDDRSVLVNISEEENYNERSPDDTESTRSVETDVEKLLQNPCVGEVFNKPVTDNQITNGYNKKTDAENIYDYIETKKSKSNYRITKTKALIYGAYFSVPSYIILTVACILLFTTYNNSSTNFVFNNNSCCLNLTSDELEYISLIVSRPFLDTIQLYDIEFEITHPLNDDEKRFLIRSILTNLNLYNNKYQLNAPIYLDYYVEEIIKYSKSQRCCSDRLCKFQKSLNADNVPYEIYVKNTDPFYKNYVYATKIFCNTYIMQLYNRFLLIPQEDKVYIRSRLYEIIYDDKFLEKFAKHVVEYVKMNKFCIS